MKTVIELLEQAQSLSLAGPWSSAVACIEEALVELKTNQGAQEKIDLQLYELRDRLGDVYSCITGEIEGDDKDKDYTPDLAKDYLDRAIDNLGFILQKGVGNRPRWETPEQREKRTGEPWPDDWAVYYKAAHRSKWDSMPFYQALQFTYDDYLIICATEAGRPPEDWTPEEEKNAALH